MSLVEFEFEIFLNLYRKCIESVKIKIKISVQIIYRESFLSSPIITRNRESESGSDEETDGDNEIPCIYNVVVGSNSE